MKLAKEMIKQGRADKALKIYLHALALDPHNPELLNSYGEFLETYKKDILNAEHNYCKAVISNPSHGKALQNHKRTLPLVEEIDRSRYKALDNKLSNFFHFFVFLTSQNDLKFSKCQINEVCAQYIF